MKNSIISQIYEQFKIFNKCKNAKYSEFDDCLCKNAKDFNHRILSYHTSNDW